MATQIQIAQALDDERELNEILLKRFDLSCLPKVFSTSHPRPAKLGKCDHAAQLLFEDNLQDIVLKNIQPVTDEVGRYLVFPKTGLCIEWNRTVQVGKGFAHGRYYYRATPPVSEKAASTMTKIMSFLVRTVQKTYVEQSDKHLTIFVGPHLATRLAQGRAHLAYPDGTVMTMAGAE